jgi:hypothetical protein
MQTKRFSLIESITNTIVGFVVSFLIQIAMYPALGIPVKFSQNLIITTIFTLASIGRGYIVRRVFNIINADSKQPPVDK